MNITACLLEDNLGLCIACGEEATGVEPDAHHYTCESCGMAKVFGLQELLIRNMYKLPKSEQEGNRK